MKRKTFFALALTAVFTLSACGSATAETAGSPSQTMQTETIQTESTAGSLEMFTDRDLEIGYDEETSVWITLSGESASCDSENVQISGSTVTITEEGSYILSGVLDNGMIVVSAEDTDKVQLVLNGVEITNEASAAIYCLEEDKVIVTTVGGTENVLTNGGEHIAMDDNNMDAVIFSKSDLTLNGAGTLTINAAAGHGIVSENNLVLTSGTYIITAASHGISGQGNVRIANGTYTITAGKDGIHAENADDTSLGYLYVAGGTFAITAEGNGLSAGSCLQIDDGDFVIVSDGSCVDSNGALTINGGTLRLTCNGSGNTAIDCDGTYTNNGGEITTNDGSESSPGQMGGTMEVQGQGE